MPLPQCIMFWVWWIWTHSSRLCTEYHLPVHLHITTDHHPYRDFTIDWPPTTVMKVDTVAVGLDPNPILTGTIAEAAMTPTETIPGHVTGTADTIPGLLPGTQTPMPIHIALTKTPHIGDHLHTEALQLTLETAADHDLDQHINQPRRPHTKIHHDPGNLKIHTLRKTQESQ